jgi:adenylate kinase family enzyme
MTPEIICPICGTIEVSKMGMYKEELRKQRFELTPIYPTCKSCGSLLTINNPIQGGEIIVLSGTCGSGKSTVAIELMKKHGYVTIDTDCVMQSFRKKKNVKQVDYRSDEMLAEIAYELDFARLFSDKLVLAQIVLREDIDRYINIFDGKGLRYKFFLLRPSYEKALERCQTRTSHAHVTPEEWIKYFYDAQNFNEGVTVIDNSNQTVEETTQEVLHAVLTTVVILR